MKKVIALAAIVFGCSMTTAMAQGGGQQTPEQRIAAMKERLKPLNLTDAQADSAVAVFTDRVMTQAIYAGADFRNMSEEDRAAKGKQLSEARQKRLEKAMPAETAKKVIETLSQRQGGGGRPGGGR